MKEYFVVLEQKEEGCDYTIGCGVTYRNFKAKNEYDLYNQIQKDYHGDNEIEIIYYTEVENIKILHIDNVKKEHDMYLLLKAKYE